MAIEAVLGEAVDDQVERAAEQAGGGPGPAIGAVSGSGGRKLDVTGNLGPADAVARVAHRGGDAVVELAGAVLTVLALPRDHRGLP